MVSVSGLEVRIFPAERYCLEGDGVPLPTVTFDTIVRSSAAANTGPAAAADSANTAVRTESLMLVNPPPPVGGIGHYRSHGIVGSNTSRRLECSDARSPAPCV